MNTVEKEMLVMLILFTFSYLPYTTENHAKSNNTKIPMKPIKQLLYWLYSFNVFNQYQKQNLHRHREMISILIFITKRLINMIDNINTGNALWLCDEQFLHINSHWIKINLTYYWIFKFNQLNFMIRCYSCAIFIFMHFQTWL